MLFGMYAAFFGLRQSPFSIAPDPRYLFMSESHREALAHLLYGVRGNGGFVLLSGEIGAGKTTVCRCFLEQLPAHCRVAYVFNPKLTVSDLLKTICHEFHVEVKHEGLGPATIRDHLDPLNAYLLASHARGERNVLIIDEAQNLTPHVLEQLRLLTNLETNERKLLQIILIGQPELRGILGKPELEQLAQRVIARFHLGTLDRVETHRYILHRMQVAGLRGPLPFSKQAMARVHVLARGVPRRINLLCDRALLGAFAAGVPRLTEAVVDQAAREVFESPTGCSKRPTGRQTARGALAWLGPVSAGATGGAVVAGALLWWWSTHEAAASTAALAVAPRALAPVAVTVPVQQPDRPFVPDPQASAVLPGAMPDLDALTADESLAWTELARLWGHTLATPNACSSALTQQLQCYRTDRMTIHGLRQLNRPGILTLHVKGQGRARALLTAMTEDSATLQSGAQRWRLSFTELAAVWRGEFATLWRTPPGHTGRLVDGKTGAAAHWLDLQIANLQVTGHAPPSTNSPAARIETFQRSQGVETLGMAGPITFMQVNLASGVDEPRLFGARPAAAHASLPDVLHP